MVPYLRPLPTPHQPEPPDYAGIYRRLYNRYVGFEDTSKDWAMRFIYVAIKGLPVMYGDIIDQVHGGPPPSKELLEKVWSKIRHTEMALSRITPGQFMTVFPVEKRYDGQRWGEKDYFSTMKTLRAIGMDTYLGDNALRVLFNYMNPHVTEFFVLVCMTVSYLRKYQGKPSLASVFLKGKNIRSLDLMSDDNGKEFLYDRARQTCHPLVKERPRYLRVVK